MSLGSTSATARSFGKYTLVAKLATGGMAEIFLARLSGAGGFEKLVCIKRILPHHARNQQFVAMFLDEARIAARISHPNVCQVYELGEVRGQYFIAMEYLEGAPLARFLHRDVGAAPLDARLVAGMAVQACEGLHHAHQLKRTDGSPAGVVHRDVSPQNLFVTADGVLKVLDFGIAKVHDASVRTTTGTVKGKYAYMSPEQLRGEALDRRSDVFALGVVLHELFTGKSLFHRDTDFLIFQAIINEPIRNVCEARPDLPAGVGAAVARALARSREERFPTARALGEAVAQAMAARGGPSAPSAIAEAIEHELAEDLEEQRILIRVASEGGELDLEEPRVAGGSSTEALTMPVSARALLSSLLASGPAEPPVAPPPPPPEPSSPRAAAPARPRRSRAIWALPAVAVLGAAAGYLGWQHYRAAPAAAPAPPTPVASAPAPVAAPPPTPVAAPAPIPVPAAAPAPAAAPEPVAVPAPRKEKPRPAVPEGPPGFITIDSVPYAVIYIDGKPRGETPLVHLELPPGRHSVRAVSPSGATRSFRIQIEPGKVAPNRRIEW